MAASGSGIATLLVCCVVGPGCLGLYEFYKRKTNSSDKQTGSAVVEGKDSSGREVVTRTEYMLGLLGYAIGIGNLWRFPFLCGRNGGAAFLVAYFLLLFFVSLPCYMIEMVMGQYTRQNTIGCFEAVHPLWRGLGWAQAFMLFWVVAYYNVLLGYSCIYIGGSLVEPFPWAEEQEGIGGSASKEYWNTGVLNRFSSLDQPSLGPVQWELALGLLAVWTMVFFAVGFGKSALAKVTWVTVVMPIALVIILLIRVSLLEASQEGVEFYIGKFEIARLGDINVWRDACVQILFSLSPGMGTAITMSSFTDVHENVYQTCWIVAICNSLFSFVGGFAIFSVVGNITYKINLQSFTDLKAQIEAALANLTNNAALETAKAEIAKVDLTGVTNFALNASAGVYLRNAVKGLLDASTDAELFTQSGLNFTETLSALDPTTVRDQAKAGPGLAFIVIADGMQTFGGARNIIAVLFFLTLLTLGLDSTFAWVETLVSYVDDALRVAGKKVPKIVSVAGVSVILFLFGLPFCTRMGNELLDTVDNYVGLMFLLFGVFIEGILFSCCFGFERFETALRTACGVTLGPIQKVYWRVTTHGTMIVIPGGVFIWNFVSACLEPYEGYPGGMQAVGFVLLIICLLLIPIGALSARGMGGSKLDDTPGAKLIEDPQKTVSGANAVAAEAVGNATAT